MSNPQAVQQRHALNRIFTLVIEIFTIVTREADPRVLLRQETVNDELRLFYCHREDLGDEFVAQQTGYTSIDAEEALGSHNYCVFVCKIFAGILAWLIEDLHLPITVEEVDLNDVSATQPVVLMDVLNWEQKRVAPIHTMFKILDSGAYPQSDGLVEEDGSYIDASAAQYLRPAGIYAVCSYPARPRSSTRLGGAYKTQLDGLHRIGMNKGYRAEAIIRTVNNEFYAKMIALGGPRILLDKDKARWAGFEREILAAMETSLRSLVANLDRQDIDDHYTETHHKLIARACFGPGHDMITRALERVSGHEGIVLLQSI